MNDHFATPHPSFSLLAFRWGCVLTVLLGNTLQAEESWWQFRGPHGDGHTAATNLPFKWSESDHVAWKTKIHDRGWSSPVIWGDQIWVTTATRDGHRLFAVCINKDTGRIVHDLHLFDVEKPMKITDENTYATPTPVIEQGRVFVHYGTYGTACLDTATGRKIWTRRDLNCDHEAKRRASQLADTDRWPTGRPRRWPGCAIHHRLGSSDGKNALEDQPLHRLHRHPGTPSQGVLHAVRNAPGRRDTNHQPRRTRCLLI